MSRTRADLDSLVREVGAALPQPRGRRGRRAGRWGCSAPSPRMSGQVAGRLATRPLGLGKGSNGCFAGPGPEALSHRAEVDLPGRGQARVQSSELPSGPEAAVNYLPATQQPGIPSLG